MQCPKCGYQPTDYEHQKSKDQCPECGIYYAKFVAQQQAKLKAENEHRQANVAQSAPQHAHPAPQRSQPANRISIKNASPVVVVDIEMTFSSMVVFMVKWAFAAIPAVIIIMAIFVVVSSILGALIAS